MTRMQKLFLNVTASVLFVALVILAQSPDGAAQGPPGPDAVATNLVTTVCASCHTLDRVKNKVGGPKRVDGHSHSHEGASSGKES